VRRRRYRRCGMERKIIGKNEGRMHDRKRTGNYKTIYFIKILFKVSNFSITKPEGFVGILTVI